MKKIHVLFQFAFLVIVIFGGYMNPVFASVSHLEGEFEFLGTMAGDQKLICDSLHSGEATYARSYKSFVGSDFLRKEISKAGDNSFGRGYIKLGENYSYTPWRLRDERPFSVRHTSMQGGGFFLVHNILKKEDQLVNCFGYALSVFGKKLEELCGQSMGRIQESVKISINSYVENYFLCVNKPIDGDLAIYQTTKPTETLSGVTQIRTGTITHAGIYRDSRPNWNSPLGGTVESKWGWLGVRKVYQHDVFFTPHFYGDLVKFYRLKSM